MLYVIKVFLHEVNDWSGAMCLFFLFWLTEAFILAAVVIREVCRVLLDCRWFNTKKKLRGSIGWWLRRWFVFKLFWWQLVGRAVFIYVQLQRLKVIEGDCFHFNTMIGLLVRSKSLYGWWNNMKFCVSIVEEWHSIVSFNASLLIIDFQRV